jgi:hypothetical protein
MVLASSELQNQLLNTNKCKSFLCFVGRTFNQESLDTISNSSLYRLFASVLRNYSSGDENDEEWGWGDDDDNNNAGIELASSYNTSETLHNRRPSNGSPRVAPKVAGLSLSPGPMNVPAVSGMSLGLKSAQKPAVPPPAPISGSSNTSGGTPSLSVGQQHQQISTSSFPSDVGGIPTRITSLGMNKAPVTAAQQQVVPKKKTIIGGTDDDIFASLGLSSQPKFSHAPPPNSAPAPRPVSTIGGGSRWATASSTTTTTTARPIAGTSSSTNFATRPLSGTTTATTTTTTFPSTTSGLTSTNLAATSGDGDDDDADWDDDADLDDLLG